MKWLVKFADNWADEMDVEGFIVLTNEEFVGYAHLIEDTVKAINSGREFEWFIGTNEWIGYCEGETFKEAFSFEVIDDRFANVLKALLLEGYGSYGLIPSSEDMAYFLEDEK